MVLSKRVPIPVPEAVEKIVAYQINMSTETVLLQDCDQRYLAEDIIATHDVPPFSRSPYDGFAIIAEDTSEGSTERPVTLEVIDAIGAGQVSPQPLKSGQAIRIMTGAPIPAGANAVIMLELVQEKKEGERTFITIKRKVKPDENISFQGEDAKKGTVLVEKGTKIEPGVVALLATFGYEQVKVYKKPIVGILATGTELLDVNEALVPGKIRNSNAYMIAAQVKKMGAEPHIFKKVPDDFDASFEAVSGLIEEVDVLITTGGVSVGDFDYLPQIYEKLGAAVLFNKIAMRPGSVTTVASYKTKLLFGLSGNPSACFVGCELFVRPYLLGSFGVKKKHLAARTACLEVDYPKPNPFTRFVRAQAESIEGTLTTRPVGLDTSGAVTSIAEANALMVLPGGTRGWSKGANVKVLLFNGEGSEWPWDECVPSR
ncbi:gephyrin-like molybdotransferase Glp [Fictibacillus sp. Mic-4]|uniref:molybdopterin molybdotransferase MoeA n=1 Tax=Fictibacillus sp. Mic-4 TaxID=3132826 RepID=UPI003CEC8B14